MQVIPALQAGAMVLADRYVYTAFARDRVRGLDREWLRRLYAFAVEPTVAFYFDVPLDEAVTRILERRPSLKFYEAGMDLALSRIPAESFRLFQGLIQKEYDHLVNEYNLVRIDATAPLINQQQRVRQIVGPYLDGAIRLEKTEIHDALMVHRLGGRYLEELKFRQKGAP